MGTPSAVAFQTPGDNCWSGGGIGYGPGTPCDHFGVGTTKNPTKTTYSWKTADSPGVTSKTLVNLPAPAWQVDIQQPPAPNVPPPPPVVMAVIEAPELPPPGQGEPQFGTAIWAKVFTTELQQPEGLEGLMHANLEAKGIALEKRADGTEMEWQLLQKDPGNPNLWISRTRRTGPRPQCRSRGTSIRILRIHWCLQTRGSRSAAEPWRLDG